MHVPEPSQRPASVCVDPVQVCVPHASPGAYRRHAPAPLHEPSVPQVFGPESAHWFSGSVLAGMAVQTPRVPPSAQDMQIPVHEPAQQTPWAQNPLLHSVPAPQDAPSGLRPQLEAVQTLPVVHSDDVVHDARQLLPLQT